LAVTLRSAHYSSWLLVQKKSGVFVNSWSWAVFISSVSSAFQTEGSRQSFHLCG